MAEAVLRHRRRRARARHRPPRARQQALQHLQGVTGTRRRQKNFLAGYLTHRNTSTLYDSRRVTVFTGLDDIPWSRLGHAYGSAVDVPDTLRALTSPDAEIAEEALS